MILLLSRFIFRSWLSRTGWPCGSEDAEGAGGRLEGDEEVS